MERHFDHDLEELKQRLLWMGSLAERAVHQAVHAVLDAEEHLAEVVLSEEDAINEMQIEIDERVQRLLATQQPMAADLRFLLAVSRINGDLERIGDQAVNIAQSATRILRHPQVKPYVDLPRMSELAEAMVRDSLNALVRGDQELAQSVLRRDDQVDRLAVDVVVGLAGDHVLRRWAERHDRGHRKPNRRQRQQRVQWQRERARARGHDLLVARVDRGAAATRPADRCGA